MELDKTNEQGETTAAGKKANKAAFIRSLPRDMPTKEIVQKAKEAGIIFDESYVHVVRSKQAHAAKLAAKPARGKPGPKPGAKKPGPKPGAKRQAAPKAARGRAATNKAGFVRNQPASMPAKDVVAAAARVGLTLTPDYVHKVRSASGVTKARKAAKRAPVAPRPAAKAPRAEAVRPAASADAAFRKLVLELGLERSRALLGDVERKLGALIAGR